MKTTKEYRNRKFIEIHVNARKACHRSQEFMALELGVSKRTIQNWEKGIGNMSFFDSLEWFRALRINPIPFYMTIISPDGHLHDADPSMSDEEVDKALKEAIDLLSPDSKRALLFLFLGKHGSSAYSVLQLMLCHLHLPLKERLYDARSVIFKYRTELANDSIICKDNIRPDLNNLDDAIDKAQDSLSKHEYGYNNVYPSNSHR